MRSLSSLTLIPRMFKRRSSKKKAKDERANTSVEKEDDDSNDESQVEDRRASSPDFWEPGELLSELFTVPLEPEFQLRTVETISVMKNYFPVLFKWLEWTFFFLLAYFQFSYAWLVCLLVAYHSYSLTKQTTDSKTRLTAQCSSLTEKEVLHTSLGLDSFPSWVVFPDFDRVEWVNVILKKIWPHIGPASKLIAKRIVEPRINQILQKLNFKSMNLESISNFKLKEFILGSVPARVGGIKAYDRNTSQEEIVLDLEIIYAGDARVKFTVQGLDCEINEINFKAVVRLVFKPLIDALPIVGGVELYFISLPSLDYNLGGMANFAEIPGISNVIRSILDNIIKRGFVWPNRFSVWLNMDSLRNLSDQTYTLQSPRGVLVVEVLRGRDLVKKDLGGKSDPYVILAIGQNIQSYKDKYVGNTVNPEWLYSSQFAVEEPSGHSLSLEVYDYDTGMEDDFMGQVEVSVNSLVESGTFQQWLSLEKTKHGEVLMCTAWCPVSGDPVTASSSRCVVSLYINSASNIGTEKKSCPTSRCEVRVGTDRRGIWSTRAKGPSECPTFRQGQMFISNSPTTDTINISVVDIKSGQSLGKVNIQLAYMFTLPDNKFSDMEWRLDTDSQEETSIRLTAKLFAY